MAAENYRNNRRSGKSGSGKYSSEISFNYKRNRENQQKAVENFLQLQKEETLSGYELGLSFFKDIKDFNWGFMPFSLMVVICFMTIFYAFKERSKITLILSAANILLLLISLVIFYFGELLEDVNLLKAGFYLLVFNLLIIILESLS